MHETTQRMLCRGLFLFGCLAPTIALAGWAASRHLPGRVEREAEAISAVLGAKVTLTDVRTPRPGVSVYEGLSLSDRETGREFFSASAVRAIRTFDGLSLSASSATVASGGLASLRPILERELRTAGRDKIHLRIDQLVLDGEQEFFRDFRALAEPTQAGRQIQVETAAERASEVAATSSSPSSDAALRLRVMRDRNAPPGAYSWELHSGDVPLSCSLLSLAVPAMNLGGPSSTFAGSMWASETKKGWQGELKGTFSGVDLARLWPGDEPPLTGTATIRIARARLRAGRLDELYCAIDAGPGQVRREFLSAAAEGLGVVPAVELEDVPEVEIYDRLALSATIDEGKITVEGKCPGASPGVVVARRQGPLLRQPDSPRAAWNILRLWTSSNDLILPISARARPLADVLPLPTP